MDKDNLVLEALEMEKERAERRLEAQIQSVRNTLDYLERKLKNGDTLFAHDGLRGSGVEVDLYLSEFVAYSKAIEFISELED